MIALRKVHGLAILAGTLAMCLPGNGFADEASEPDTSAVFDKWVETRRLISRERAEWTTGKEAMQERAALLQREIDGVREKIAQVKTDAGSTEKSLADTQMETDRIKTNSALVRETVTDLETKLRPLIKRMPDPVRERIKPLIQRLPENPTDTKMPLPERIQAVLGILNEVAKANNDVTLCTEIHTLPDGQRAEVKAVYVGLAQAYFVSAKGDAGVGRPGPEGWAWTFEPGLAQDITETIQIMQNKSKPRFVAVPVSIK